MSNIANTTWVDTTLDAQRPLNGWPASDSQGGAGVAACHGGHVQYVLPDHNKKVTIVTSSLLTYQSTHHFPDLNNWTITWPADGFPASMNSEFFVDNLLSIASVGDYNYIFWSNTRNGVLGFYALRTSPDMLTPPALARIDLQNDAGHQYYGNLACFALPGMFADIEGKIGVLAAYKAGPEFYMRSLLLDPADFVANSPWPVQSTNNAINSSLGSEGISINYSNISAGWCNLGEGLTAVGSPPVANVALVVTAGSGSGCKGFYGDLLEAFSADYNLKVKGATEALTNVRLTAFANKLNVDDNTSATLCQTPDGELLAQYNVNQQVHLAVFVPPAAGQTKPTWQTYAPASTAPALTSQNTSCSVFIPLASSVGPSPVPVLPPAGGTKQTYPNCTIQNYVQFVLTSDTNHLPQVATRYWGCFFTVPGYNSATYTGGKQSLVSLLADTFPYPVPDPVVWGADSPSGMVNWLVCSYDYLTGNQTEVDIDYTLRSSVGMRYANTALVAGIGMQVEASLSAGFSLATSQADTTRRATAFSVITKGLPGADSRPVLPISPSGTFFGTPPPGTIYVDMVLVLKRGAADISGTMAAVLRPASDNSEVAASGTYTSYLYTPGNLASYSEEAINTAMVARFAKLSADEQKDFTINGVNYASYYQSTQPGAYLKSIVEAFGVNEFGPDGNLPYLEFAFSETGVQRSEFQSTSAFRVGGSAFIDGSCYAGLAWGLNTDFSVGFLGILALKVPLGQVNGYAMVGAEFATELAAASTSTTEWGVQLGEYLNPLNTGEAYSVRMYILKPSPLWARELQYFGDLPGGNAVDTANSAPVRILFTVPYLSPTLAARLASQSAPAEATPVA